MRTHVCQHSHLRAVGGEVGVADVERDIMHGFAQRLVGGRAVHDVEGARIHLTHRPCGQQRALQQGINGLLADTHARGCRGSLPPAKLDLIRAALLGEALCYQATTKMVETNAMLL